MQTQCTKLDFSGQNVYAGSKFSILSGNLLESGRRQGEIQRTERQLTTLQNQSEDKQI